VSFYYFFNFFKFYTKISFIFSLIFNSEQAIKMEDAYDMQYQCCIQAWNKIRHLEDDIEQMVQSEEEKEKEKKTKKREREEGEDEEEEEIRRKKRIEYLINDDPLFN
jgi:hypothetical protein